MFSAKIWLHQIHYHINEFWLLLHYEKHFHHINTKMHDGYIVTCGQIFPFIFGLKKGLVILP